MRCTPPQNLWGEIHFHAGGQSTFPLKRCAGQSGIPRVCMRSSPRVDRRGHLPPTATVYYFQKTEHSRQNQLRYLGMLIFMHLFLSPWAFFPKALGTSTAHLATWSFVALPAFVCLLKSASPLFCVGFFLGGGLWQR
jgi:hypothetical protein